MSIILKNPVTGPAAWTGQDIQNDTSWIEQLQASDIQALDEALATLKSKGRAFPNFEREDFPIGTALLKGSPLCQMSWKMGEVFFFGADCPCIATAKMS